MSLQDLAISLLNLADLPDGESSLRAEATRIYVRLVERFPDNTGYAAELAALRGPRMDQDLPRLAARLTEKKKPDAAKLIPQRAQPRHRFVDRNKGTLQVAGTAVDRNMEIAQRTVERCRAVAIEAHNPTKVQPSVTSIRLVP